MLRIRDVAIAMVLASLSFSANADSAAGLTPTQLPRSVRPSHYEVAIVPHAETLTFDGHVTVSIDVLEPTPSIKLNALDISFTSARLTPAVGEGTIAAPIITIDASTQTATFVFAKPIPRGSYQLSMDYVGKIGTQANGIFAIDYDTQSGKKRALYTQFENSDARRLIPSWDEPSYKATFTLQATVPGTQMAVSNMPVAESIDLGNGQKRVRFAPSPKMSTYLLFFGLGDFDRITAPVDGTEVGVVMQKGLASQAAFALKSSEAILHEYNGYFGTPYPLPKLDNIASPGSSQFFGAMENWGAIYTFEYAILLDPTISTATDKQYVFTTTAHEMAHQWFGDLVTMHWWDDLWLNEGFASWMEGRTTEKLHPEWNTALAAVGVRETAMARDAVATAHPVVQHIETVEQASQAFDSITYSKGEAVIRMIEGYVGADTWRDGVRRYMRAHAYGNTVSDDLWREIEAAAGKPILAVAHDFTLQPGVPMIRVERATCTDGKTNLQLTQREYTTDRPDKTPLAWRVPVIASRLGGELPVRALVTDGKASMTIPGCGTIIVNAGQSGYYRTVYAPEQLAGITRNFAKLAPIDQLGILADSWSLGLAGYQPMSGFLDLTKVTPIDADPQIWGTIARSFASIDDYTTGQLELQARFRSYATARLAPVFARVGWAPQADELDTVAILRNNLIGTLSALGDPAIIAEARRRYAARTTDPTAIPAGMRRTILGVVARHADTAKWNRLHKAARVTKTPLVKDQLYSLLSTSEDETLARRALDLALSEEPGATNSASMIGEVAWLHPDLAFDFAIAHLAAVNEKVDSTSRSRYFAYLASRSLDPAMIDKLKAYAIANLAAGSRRDADTAVVNITYRISVRNKRLPEIDAWLTARR